MRIYGKNPVLERLKSNPQSIKKIFVEAGNAEAEYIRSKSRKWGIPFYSIPREKMVRMVRNLNAQGVLMEVEEFAYVSFPDLLEQACAEGLSLLFLDSLVDPQNLGGIIRSAACLGDFAIVLSTHDSAGVTETVLRVASGGENHVSVARVSNLGNAISDAKKAGYWIAGAVVDKGQNLYETTLSFPLGLVVGSEQKGIRDILRKQLDVAVSIPMAQERLSMNVAHAVTAFCYEITKQKKHQK